MRALKNYIGGKWAEASTGRRRQCFNPADRDEVICETPESAAADVETALHAAEEGFPVWSNVPSPKRGELLEKFLQLFRTREDEFSRTITRENGKTLRESRKEFQSALKETAFQISQARRDIGGYRPSESLGVTCQLRREPLGVVVLVTPWNFPLGVVCRKLVPALVAGNSCILKPADLTPMTAALLFELLHDIGMPSGVVNLLFGRGSVIGEKLVSDPIVKAVSFTGSTEVGLAIAKNLAGHDTRLQLEMGGKNPLVVLADADLDSAVEAAIIGGYSCSGQWCTSTSRVIVEDEVYTPFLAKLTQRVNAIVVGNGEDDHSSMGPVCGPQQYDSVLRYIQIGKHEGARMCAGGNALTKGKLSRGWFIAPTLFADVSPQMVIAREEIFGPVLVVMKARDFDHALELANDSPYGLCSSIYTRDMTKGQSFIARTEVGMCHVNLPTSHREPQLEFGGIKESGRGLPEAGDSALEFFTKHKAVYLGQGG